MNDVDELMLKRVGVEALGDIAMPAMHQERHAYLNLLLLWQTKHSGLHHLSQTMKESKAWWTGGLTLPYFQQHVYPFFKVDTDEA